jgi:heme A synthase
MFSLHFRLGVHWLACCVFMYLLLSQAGELGGLMRAAACVQLTHLTLIMVSAVLCLAAWRPSCL